MNEWRLFTSAEFGPLHAVERAGQPWFAGKDVARALRYDDMERALSAHVPQEDRGRCRWSGGGRQRSVVILSAAGVEALVRASKAPGAARFGRWVAADVLPALRSRGGGPLPGDYPAALRAMADLAEQLLAAEEENRANRPKVLFADAVSAASSTILVGELAKLLRQNGVEIGQNRLFRWMRDKGFLIRRQGADFNMPTQKAMEMGLFEIKETVIARADGHTCVNRTPKVTGKGQQYFMQRFLGGA